MLVSQVVFRNNLASILPKTQRKIVIRRLGLEVALFALHRAKGPAIYLAQPEGLGVRRKSL